MNPPSPYPNKTFPSFFLVGICWLFCFSGQLAWAQPYQELKGWVGQNPFERTGTHQGQSLYQDKQFQNIFLGLLKNNMPSEQAEEIWGNILKQSEKA